MSRSPSKQYRSAIDASEQERRNQLLRDISNGLNATSKDNVHKDIYACLGQIGANLEYNIYEAQKAAAAPKLKESRKRLESQAKRYEKTAATIDPNEPFEHLFGTATDNRYDDLQIHEDARQKHIERLHRRQILKKLLMEEAADCRERENSPGWQTRGGRSNTYSMAHGDPLSAFFTDCCKLFEEFRPGEILHTPGGDFEIVAGNIFEFLTGQRPEPPDLSLEYHVRKAVDLHKRNIGNK